MTESSVMICSKVGFDQLSLTDFSRIVNLERNCGLPDPYDPPLIQALLIEMDNFVCRIDGEIVGFVTVNPRSSYLGGSIYIVNINVAAPQRGQGIAKQLLRTACQHYAPLCPGALVSLDVTKTNPARRLYNRIGFIETTLPSRNGKTDIVMAAPLSRLLENLDQLIRAHP